MQKNTARLLKPREIQSLYPKIYEVFFAQVAEEIKPVNPPNDYPQRSEFKSAKKYWDAVGVYLRGKQGTLV